MVRLFIGTMVDAARGYISLDDVRAALSQKKVKDSSNVIKRIGQAAPAHGLVLESIQY
jgi:tRNA U38,U39,U40 pseudouridine synthase TruA